MNIRKAEKSDIDNNLFQLFKEGFLMHYNKRKDVFPDLDENGIRDIFQEMFDNEDKLLYVIADDSKIVGFIEFIIKEKKTKSLWIDELFIDGSYRRRGYGKQLMDFAYDFAKKNNCQRVELNCWVFNDDAHIFYDNLDFIKQRIVYEKIVE